MKRYDLHIIAPMQAREKGKYVLYEEVNEMQNSLDKLQAQNAELRDALEDIIEHVELPYQVYKKSVAALEGVLTND